MTISKRDAKLLLILLGILILLVGYLAIYNPYMERTDTVQAEIQSLRPTLTELEGYAANLDSYQAGIDAASEMISTEMEGYAQDVRSEDLVMYAIELEEKVGMDITSMELLDSSVILEFTGMKKNEDGSYSSVPLIARQNGMTTTCRLSYQQLKDMIDYIEQTQLRTSLENVTISFDAESGQLVGSAAMNKYFITGSDYVYEETEVPNLRLGRGDLFGTLTAQPQPEQ